MSSSIEPIPIGQILSQYQNEFLGKYDQMRNKLQARSRQFKQFVFENSAIMKTAEGNPEVRMSMGIVQPIKDLTSICVADLFLVQSFSWLTFVMFAYWISFQCFSGLLRPFICMFGTNGQIALLAFLGPIVTCGSIKSSIDLDNRFVLLYYAIAEGIMMGHLFPDLYLNLPLPFIIPASITIVSYSFSTRTSSPRPVFLSISLGIGLVMNILIGSMIYHEGIKFVFLFALLIDSLGTVIFLQYYINRCMNDHLVGLYFDLFCCVCKYIVIQTFLLILFGHRENSSFI
ncbi:hypothetical protein Mgra_00009144 [Meloidogyne graminicola]|uniref:Uncharacterized protein n=1 Tax=Meloidogyne graminicola TaxID=189291 RepID=A0A8S9ZDT2_9BILA|nr:hypothetical protein Mgra_00009144 [Meloidogyne graminicola]